MSERDDELLRRYRTLGREVPPPALDAAILAASRRAVRRRAVPRWAAPVSVAAVLVLALGLVLKVQREALSPEIPKPEAKQAAPARPAAARTQSAPAAAAPTPAPSAPAAAAAPPASGAPPAAESSADRASSLDTVPRANIARPPLAAQRAVAPDPLRRELERIARLRADAKDDEADAALAVFRREHPDYRIEPALWERVRRR